MHHEINNVLKDRLHDLRTWGGFPTKGLLESIKLHGGLMGPFEVQDSDVGRSSMAPLGPLLPGSLLGGGSRGVGLASRRRDAGR